jgi:Protein of unknown function (DUF2795)
MSTNPTFQNEQDLAAAMSGIDFPTQRDGLVEQAKKNRVSQDVIDRLSRLRDGDFSNVAEVMDATNNS